jgi:hypothetical protein
LLRTIVPVELPPPRTEAGLNVNVVITTGRTRYVSPIEVEPSLAVMVAVNGDVTRATVTPKVAEDAPAAIFTVAGTLT